MSTVILLRTHRFGGRERAFAVRLRDETGHDVHIVADESHGALDCAPFSKISLSQAAVRDMGLPCPRDFAWRCGDYSFYAARRALPEATRFWLIEPDVRFAVPHYGDVFARLDAIDADFLATHVIASDRAHFWYPTMRWLTPHVFRCGFALCRIYATAADLCLMERRRLAQFLPAKIMWPNDETFVATFLKNAGLRVRDVNEAGRVLCTQASFGFAEPHHGEALDTMQADGLIYHPVLWGDDYTRKTSQISRGLRAGEIARLKLLRGLARAQQAAGWPREA